MAKLGRNTPRSQSQKAIVLMAGLLQITQSVKSGKRGRLHNLKVKMFRIGRSGK
jgi:hypothetical protein